MEEKRDRIKYMDDLNGWMGRTSQGTSETYRDGRMEG
jgi:hypothetical protein